MKRQLASVVAVVGVLATGCTNSGASGSADADAMTKVTYVTASSVPGAVQFAIYAVPKELGFFAAERLDVTLESTSGSTAALQVVASRGALATNPEIASTMAAVSKGVGVKSFGSIVTNFPWRIGVPAGTSISSAADLKGKKIGIISLASASNLFARTFLTQNHLNPDTDVKLVPVGQGAQAKAALDAGQVDALSLYLEGFTQLETTGMSLRYLDNPELFDGMPSVSFAARAASLNGAERDQLMRFGRAAYKGLMFAAINPKAAVRIALKVFPQIAGPGGVTPEKSAAVLAQFKAWLASAVPQQGNPASWPDWGNLSEASLAKAAEYALATGQVDRRPQVDEAWDGGLVAEMNNFDKPALIAMAEKYPAG